MKPDVCRVVIRSLAGSITLSGLASILPRGFARPDQILRTKTFPRIETLNLTFSRSNMLQAVDAEPKYVPEVFSPSHRALPHHRTSTVALHIYTILPTYSG